MIYINQWTKDMAGNKCYHFLIYSIELHRMNLKYNTLILTIDEY